MDFLWYKCSTVACYSSGTRQVASVLEGHDDSIGLATFGGQNTIVQIATSNYDLVLNQIGNFKAATCYMLYPFFHCDDSLVWRSK